MSNGSYLHRVLTVRRALRAHRALDRRDHGSREALLAYQRARFAELVTFASRSSRFYRNLYGGMLSPHEVKPDELPTVDKPTMMANFDDVVTDPRLRLEDVNRHLEALKKDELYLDRYRVMASGGSSGVKGVYVYDRDAWDAALSGLLRWSTMIGAGPKWPRRRIAAIGAPDGRHMTYRLSSSIDVGLHRVLRMAATEPIERLVAELNAFQPEVLQAYPSVAAALADEQREGRLHIRPQTVATSSELRTSKDAAKIRSAWGVDAFDCLGLTETGIAGVECAAHRGMHVFEDLCMFEVVDEKGRLVPEGEMGARVLVTNLCNYAQPLIRFEVTDMMSVTTEPCACGRPSSRITAIDGRSEAVLEFPSDRGAPVRVHFIHWVSWLSEVPSVAEYQIVQEGDDLTVSVVLRSGAPTNETTAELDRVLRARLASLGVDVPLTVRVVDRLAREGSAGKLQLVKRRQAAPSCTSSSAA